MSKYKHIYLLLFILIFVACNSKSTFILEGHLPDNSYDGEWVYFLPVGIPPVELVDSTIIKNGTFTFTGKAKEKEIFVVRSRPRLRLKLQEILVVKEPGKILVTYDLVSKATGTALNDTLQSWKEKKEAFSMQSRILRGNYKKAPETEEEIIQNKLDSLRLVQQDYYYHFLKNNKENVVGELTARFTKAFLTSEQKKELGIE